MKRMNPNRGNSLGYQTRTKTCQRRDKWSQNSGKLSLNASIWWFKKTRVASLYLFQVRLAKIEYKPVQQIKESVNANNMRRRRDHLHLVDRLSILPLILEVLRTIFSNKRSMIGKRVMNWHQSGVSIRLTKIALKSWAKCLYHIKLLNIGKIKGCYCSQEEMILAIF